MHVLKRERQREIGGDETMETDIGVIWSQGKKYQGVLEPMRG